MGSRRRAREFALQALYQADLRELSAPAALNNLWSGVMDDEGMSEDTRPPESAEIEFAQRLVDGVMANQERIDALIEECSTNWRLARMPVVDRNILRLAAFELLECPDIPGSVSVNEAVELAKTFGTADSRAFVNGIVDRIGRLTNRLDPSRRGRRR